MGKSAFQETDPASQAADAAQRADQLEAMGRATGGVAHDFNNLLTVIMGITEHLATTLDEGSEQQQLARDGMLAAERGVQLVGRLLSASRRASRTPETIDCNGLVDEVATLVRHTLPGNVQLMPVETWRPLTCTADRTDLVAALLNFCANAHHAMPNGGRLSLAAEYAVLNERAAEPLGLSAGRYVVFEVCDTGTGMSPEVLGRATEAFFTTKGAAGTGLGLAESEAFARETGGALSINSRPGEGTMVSLYMPAAGAAPKVCRLEARS